jgi:hypothetical protein
MRRYLIEKGARGRRRSSKITNVKAAFDHGSFLLINHLIGFDWNGLGHNRG